MLDGWQQAGARPDVAGGMQRGHSGLTLAERSAMSGVAPPPLVAGRGEQAPVLGAGGGRSGRPSAGCPRHCWLTDLPGVPGRCPALLLDWSRASGTWAGRVVYAVDDGEQVVLVEAWVPAKHLAPADA